MPTTDHGGLPVSNHAVTRFRERIVWPGLHRLTGMDLRRIIRRLVRSAELVWPENTPTAPKRVLRAHFGPNHRNMAYFLVGGDADEVGDKVITVFNEEVFSSWLAKQGAA